VKNRRTIHVLCDSRGWGFGFLDFNEQANRDRLQACPSNWEVVSALGWSRELLDPPPARGSPTHITRRHARSDQRRYQGATLTIRSSSTRLTTVIGTWKRVAATRRCGRKQVPAVCRGFGIAGARSGAPLRSLAAQFSLHQRSTAIDRTPTTLATSFGSASRNASSGVSFSASRAGS
jgi:hypothetical protein